MLVTGEGATFFTAEEVLEHGRCGKGELTQAKRDHGEDRTGPARGERADDDRQDDAHQAAKERQERRHVEAGQAEGLFEEIGHVDHGITAKAVVNRVTKGQHAPLAQQHVVRHGEQDDGQRLREQRVGWYRDEAQNRGSAGEVSPQQDQAEDDEQRDLQRKRQSRRAVLDVVFANGQRVDVRAFCLCGHDLRLPLTQKALRPEDQDQHHEQIGEQTAHLLG